MEGLREAVKFRDASINSLKEESQDLKKKLHNAQDLEKKLKEKKTHTKINKETLPPQKK